MKEVIYMRYCRFEQSELDMIRAITLESFHQFCTKLVIANKPYDIKLEMIMKQMSTCPNIYGLWYDLILANVDSMANNMIKDSLDKILFSSSFTAAGVQYTIECQIQAEVVPAITGAKNAKSRK